MNAETEMAHEFAKYGDLIVGFVVVQSLSFAYALAHEGALREALLQNCAQIMRVLVYAGFGYVSLIIFCGYWEHSLRLFDHQSEVVLHATVAACIGRIVAITATTTLACYGLRLNKPS